MAQICDRCSRVDDSEDDEDVEFGDCLRCGGHFCVDCLPRDTHDCEEEGRG